MLCSAQVRLTVKPVVLNGPWLLLVMGFALVRLGTGVVSIISEAGSLVCPQAQRVLLY